MAEKEQKLGILKYTLRILGLDDEGTLKKYYGKLVKRWFNDLEKLELKKQRYELEHKDKMREFEAEAEELDENLKRVWVLTPDELKDLKPTGFVKWSEEFDARYDAAIKAQDEAEEAREAYLEEYDTKMKNLKLQVKAIQFKIDTANAGFDK